MLNKIEKDTVSTTILEQSQRGDEEQRTTESMIMLPYQGPNGDKLLQKLKKTINKIDKAHTTKIIYTSTKLSSQFVVKDQTIKEHKNGLVYKVECPDHECNATYIGEVSRRLSERIKDHGGRDHKSHVFTHTMESGHQPVTKDNFTVLFNTKQLHNYYKRTTTEALTIKKEKPSLNAQEKSAPLKLFI